MKPAGAGVCLALLVGFVAVQDRLDFVQQLPVELEWQRGEKGVDALTLTVLGKYRAVMPVMRE
jgi:hypothetical protein